jgi:hypothetical protein
MIYAVGVDTSIAFTKDVYYFRYKGTDLPPFLVPLTNRVLRCFQ